MTPAHHPCASPLRITPAHHPCASPLRITLAHHPCASPLRITLAHHPCASPLRIALAYLAAHVRCSKWARGAVDHRPSNPSELPRPLAVEAAAQLAARYHASRMKWMPVIVPLLVVPRGTNGRCALALVKDAIEHAAAGQRPGSTPPAGGRGPRVFHVEHPRPGYLASRRRATNGVAAEEPTSGCLHITDLYGAVARDPRGSLVVGERAPCP
jgi:hypothetical protein